LSERAHPRIRIELCWIGANPWQRQLARGRSHSTRRYLQRMLAASVGGAAQTEGRHAKVSFSAAPGRAQGLVVQSCAWGPGRVCPPRARRASPRRQPSYASGACASVAKADRPDRCRRGCDPELQQSPSRASQGVANVPIVVSAPVATATRWVGESPPEGNCVQLQSAICSRSRPAAAWRVNIIAAILEAPVIEKILKHLGLQAPCATAGANP